MYARNRSGANRLPCATPDVTLTSSYNCPPTPTLCERPNDLAHTTTLESTPEDAIFISSRSYETKSKSFEKSIIIASTLAPSSANQLCSGRLWLFDFRTSIPGLKPSWPSYNHLLVSQTCLRYPAVTCSICLQTLRLSRPVCSLWLPFDLTLVNRNHCGSFPVTWNSSIVNC